MTTFERIQELAKKRDKSLKDISLELGFSKNYLYTLKKQEPGIDKLTRIADYFDVSIDYLLGRSDNDTPNWATDEDILELDRMLTSNVSMSYGGENLTDDEKQRVKDILTGIFWEKLEKQKKRKK